VECGRLNPCIIRVVCGVKVAAVDGLALLRKELVDKFLKATQLDWAELLYQRRLDLVHKDTLSSGVWPVARLQHTTTDCPLWPLVPRPTRLADTQDLQLLWHRRIEPCDDRVDPVVWAPAFEQPSLLDTSTANRIAWAAHAIKGETRLLIRESPLPLRLRDLLRVGGVGPAVRKQCAVGPQHIWVGELCRSI